MSPGESMASTPTTISDVLPPRARHLKTRSKQFMRWLGGSRYALGSIIGLLAIWQISAAYIPEYIFPGIPKVIEKGAELLGDPASYLTMLVTLQRIIGGFFLSAIAGITLGIAMGMSPRINNYLSPALKFVMGVPALTWVLLAIIWFRSTELRVWFMMFVLVFPIVATNTLDGVKAISHELYQAVRSLRPTRTGMLRMLIIPGATPFIFTGLRVALSFGGRIAMFAEALSASSGIGAAMFSMNQVFDSAGIIAWTFILIGILTALDGILGIVERHWFSWRKELQI
jgi:NitT/TauT family transport system permease protein